MPVDSELYSAPGEESPLTTVRAPGDGTDADFRREVTPTWLVTTCLLAGQPAPDLTRPFRYVHLGSGSAVTATVVAAAHPDADVWAWDSHANGIETTRRLPATGGPTNLQVHEHSGLPPDLGGDPADIIVVQDVMVHASDELRAQIVAAIGANLRSGGLVCVTYKTTVGWTEIAPVVGLMRYVALRYDGEPAGLVDHVLDLLATLRAGGAEYLAARPVVAAWLDQLAVTDDATIVSEYLLDPFRPISHAELSRVLEPLGCEFVGGARLTDKLDLDLPAPLKEVVTAAPTHLLREASRDLAVRRSYRLDVFRLGSAPPSAAQRQAQLETLELAGLTSTGARPVLGVDPTVWARLIAGAVPITDVTPDRDRRAEIVRVLLDTGQAYPVLPGGQVIDIDLVVDLGAS